MIKIIIHFINGKSCEIHGIYSADDVVKDLSSSLFTEFRTDEGYIYVNRDNVAYIEEVDDDE